MRIILRRRKMLYLIISVVVAIIIIVALVSLLVSKGSKSSPSPTPTPAVDPGPFPNNKNPKIQKFMKYLSTKLLKALHDQIVSGKDSGGTPAPWGPDNVMAMGIYIKNTPGNLGPVKVWAQYCGNGTKSTCHDTADEPKFYFGSGTKPLTATLAASQLYKVWRTKNPTSDPKKFLTWYGGVNDAGGAGGATYKDLFEMTDGFKDSKYYETLNGPSNTQSGTGGRTQTLTDWLFCCPKNGLVTNCETGLFCDNTCSLMCPIPLDTQKYGDKCGAPLCPDSICKWSRYAPTEDKKNNWSIQPNPLDPNTLPWDPKHGCSCPVIQPASYQSLLQSLSMFDVAMMRSGIPDSDSIWGIDTSAQLASRTHSIGPIEFVGEIIGFDWTPGWKKDSSGNWAPMTPGTDNDQSNATKPIWTHPSKFPAAQYSSSAYTFLGILLWLLDNSNGSKKWSDINVNSMLPVHLQSMINFGGTIGNGGSQYFQKDLYGETYYSYELTVSKGGVVHSPLLNCQPDGSGGSMDCAPINKQQTDLGKINGKLRMAPVAANGFVDWDASSGVMCGNSWGTPSNMAEIMLNICCPDADNPIMDKEIQKDYVNQFINYTGPNADNIVNNQIRSPFCLGGTAWGQGGTYNCGVMGPDWFNFYDDPDSNTNYGIIPSYGHLGDTYGYCSCTAYIPGKCTAYGPWKNMSWAYSKPNWERTFFGGNDFAMSCVQNGCITESDGPISLFIAEIIKDPFLWT